MNYIIKPVSVYFVFCYMITCLEPDRSEETTELPTTKGDNQVSDTYNPTSESTNLIPAQRTSTASLVAGFELDWNDKLTFSTRTMGI
jgi:hypothetical protein